MFPRIILQSLLLIALSAIAGCITNAVHPKAPGFFLVKEAPGEDSRTMKQVHQEWEGDVLWIDARETTDYEKNHLPGALSLPPENYGDMLHQHFEAILTETRPIVVYCDGASCGRSKKVAEQLRSELNLENVYFLRGGWNS